MTCSSFTELKVEHFSIIHKTASPLFNRVLEALEKKERRPKICVQKDRLYVLKIPWD